jgi:hypothetical protein
MRQDLSDKLLTDFYDLFHTKYGGKNRCTSIGHEVGAGWYDIVHTALTKINFEVEEAKRKRPILANICRWVRTKLELVKEEDDEGQPESLKIVQIKEKFGGLRIYYTGWWNPAVEQAIKEAEEQAYKTCEVCGGKPATQTSGGWIKTKCDRCAGR